jgi:hypothetical protein
VNNDLKGCGRKLWWPNLRHYHGMSGGEYAQVFTSANLTNCDNYRPLPEDLPAGNKQY